MTQQDDGPLVKGDPFYESQENHNLIGVANIFLECLFHDVTLDYHVPIISQQGEVIDVKFLKLHPPTPCVHGNRKYIPIFFTTPTPPPPPSQLCTVLLKHGEIIAFGNLG